MDARTLFGPSASSDGNVMDDAPSRMDARIRPGPSASSDGYVMDDDLCA